MTEEVKPGAIINCDLRLDLRIAGHEKPHLSASTDEGDGYTLTAEYTGLDPNYYEPPKSYHYEEWAGQLETIAALLRARAKEKN